MKVINTYVIDNDVADAIFTGAKSEAINGLFE